MARGIAGIYKFKPSPSQLKFIEDFGRARNWQGFYGGDLFGQEHRTARALEWRHYLTIRQCNFYESWRYEWTERAKAI
jgi:hypothetical protein